MKELNINGTKASATVDDKGTATAIALNLIHAGVDFQQSTTVTETGACEWQFDFRRTAVPLMSELF